MQADDPNSRSVWVTHTTLNTPSFLNPPLPIQGFLSVSSLWGHRVRRHQSCWKALPYWPSHAKSALEDSGNGWWRRILDHVVTFKNSSDSEHLVFIFSVDSSAYWCLMKMLTSLKTHLFVTSDSVFLNRWFQVCNFGSNMRKCVFLPNPHQESHDKISTTLLFVKYETTDRRWLG